MSTLTITEFLEARITEDEAVARAVVDGPNWTSDEESYVVLHDDSGVCYDVASEEVSQHIARHDPARVLAECAAKRAIIEAHPITDDVVEVSTRVKYGYACETCFSYGDIIEDNGYCNTLRALAEVYADHPDYRQEWAL